MLYRVSCRYFGIQSLNWGIHAQHTGECNLPASHDKPNQQGLCDTPGHQTDNM